MRGLGLGKLGRSGAAPVRELLERNKLRRLKNKKSGDGAATREVHDSEDGALAPDSIVAEGLDDLDARAGWRFACCPLALVFVVG